MKVTSTDAWWQQCLSGDRDVFFTQQLKPCRSLDEEVISNKTKEQSLQMKHRLFLSVHSNGAYHNSSDMQVIQNLIHGRGIGLQIVLTDRYWVRISTFEWLYFLCYTSIREQRTGFYSLKDVLKCLRGYIFKMSVTIFCTRNDIKHLWCFPSTAFIWFHYFYFGQF